MAVNLTGAYLCMKYGVSAMVQNGGGVVVNVASEAGIVGIKGQVAYNVSKAGTISLTKTLAMECAPLGIRVNAIAPGFFLTDQNRRLRSGRWTRPRPISPR